MLFSYKPCQALEILWDLDFGLTKKEHVSIDFALVVKQFYTLPFSVSNSFKTLSRFTKCLSVSFNVKAWKSKQI